MIGIFFVLSLDFLFGLINSSCLRLFIFCCITDSFLHHVHHHRTKKKKKKKKKKSIVLAAIAVAYKLKGATVEV
jgi:amino acid transporter